MPTVTPPSRAPRAPRTTKKKAPPKVVTPQLTPEEEKKLLSEKKRHADALAMGLPITSLKQPIKRGEHPVFDDYVHRGADRLQLYLSSMFRVLISDGDITTFVGNGTDIVPPFRSITPGTALRTGLLWYDSLGVWHGADEIEGRTLGYQRVAHGDNPL